MTDEKKRRHTIDIRVNETPQGFYLNIWDADGVQHVIAIGETISRAQAVAQEILSGVKYSENELSWKINPDRMGGQFTSEEIARAQRGG